MNNLLNEVDEIPITKDDYFYMLYNRGFTKKLAIQHTKMYYKVPERSFFNAFIELKHKIDFDCNNDIFSVDKKQGTFFVGNNLEKDFETRQQAVRFYRTIIDRYNMLTLGKSEIHHIFPVVYGGKNTFHNLIGVSTHVHSLLHDSTWWEQDKVLCNRAIDFLCIMYWQKPFFYCCQKSVSTDNIKRGKFEVQAYIDYLLFEYMERLRKEEI